MPWGVFKTGSEDKPYCVYRVDGDGGRFGKSLGCHPSKEAANSQIRAVGMATHETGGKMESYGQVNINIAPPVLIGEDDNFSDVDEKASELAMGGKPYPNEHACRIRDPGDFKAGSFRRITRGAETGAGARDGKQLSIIIGRLKGKTTTTAQAYRYDKDDWTVAQARSHCAENDGSFEAAKSIINDDESLEEEMDEIESASRPSKLQSLKEKFESILEDIVGIAGSAKAKDEKPVNGFKTFTAKDGKTWLLIWTTNAFKDRDGEIFTTKSIEEYVERHAQDEKKGEMWFWHIPGSKFADVLWQGMSGRFLVEAGPFDDTYIGGAFKDFFLDHGEKHPAIAPLGWGTSHGYMYRPKDREDKVYDWFEKKESSVLPRSEASNLYNPKMEVIRVNEDQINALKAIGGDELAQAVIATGETLTKELEPDVAHKATEKVEPEPETDKQPEPASGEVKETEPEAEKAGPEPKPETEVEYMTKEEATAGFMALAGVIKEQREAMVTLAEAVKELIKSDEQKIAEKAAATPKASIADMIGSVIGLKETRIDGRTKLAKEGPEETEPTTESITGIPLIDAIKKANIESGQSRGGDHSER